MRYNSRDAKKISLGIIGMGAFGTLMARHLAGHFDVWVHDQDHFVDTADLGVRSTTFSGAASCHVVVVATPVSSFEAVFSAVGKVCRPDALIVDVGSVKVLPASQMLESLPKTTNVVATHPLFGPQGAQRGLSGLKIAVCPLRGRGHRALVRFLSRRLGLEVIATTPEAHDREMAEVQGLTHFIAKVLLEMLPLPRRMTTPSFDLLVEAISLVKDDAPEVLEAIERTNPSSESVRNSFLDAVRQANERMQDPVNHTPRRHAILGAISNATMTPEGVGR